MKITLLGQVANTQTVREAERLGRNTGEVGDHFDWNDATAQPLIDTGRACDGWVSKKAAKELVKNRFDRTVRGEAQRLMAKAEVVEQRGGKGAKAEAARLRKKANEAK